MSRPQLRRWRLVSSPPSGVPGLALLALLALRLAAGTDCPCQEPELCHPIRHHPDFEVSAFLCSSRSGLQGTKRS
ncbi:CTBS isoform 4 [Pan troglodytes]|uniref:CTBS isoform 3 n=1 Tax=Pan troglodytes TaxID=9598 RepID=A0A2J8K8B9_PANTR|nr:CTBS isoform 3 [Pan troglodytes]PNI31277.1 CTBS isoform 4 [Pan troglodytes]